MVEGREGESGNFSGCSPSSISAESVPCTLPCSAGAHCRAMQPPVPSEVSAGELLWRCGRMRGGYTWETADLPRDVGAECGVEHHPAAHQHDDRPDKHPAWWSERPSDRQTNKNQQANKPTNQQNQQTNKPTNQHDGQSDNQPSRKLEGRCAVQQRHQKEPADSCWPTKLGQRAYTRGTIKGGGHGGGSNGGCRSRNGWGRSVPAGSVEATASPAKPSDCRRLSSRDELTPRHKPTPRRTRDGRIISVAMHR